MSVESTGIPAPEYCAIEAMIASDDSPVGIDAKKTHVIILHKLMRIEARLEKLERLGGGGAGRPPAAPQG